MTQEKPLRLRASASLRFLLMLEEEYLAVQFASYEYGPAAAMEN